MGNPAGERFHDICETLLGAFPQNPFGFFTGWLYLNLLEIHPKILLDTLF